MLTVLAVQGVNKIIHDPNALDQGVSKKLFKVFKRPVKAFNKWLMAIHKIAQGCLDRPSIADFWMRIVAQKYA